MSETREAMVALARPCPFCGELPAVIYESISAWSVDCKNPRCMVAPGLRGYLQQSDAITIWNERWPTPALTREEIALLRIPHLGNDGDPEYPTDELTALADKLEGLPRCPQCRRLHAVGEYCPCSLHDHWKSDCVYCGQTPLMTPTAASAPSAVPTPSPRRTPSLNE